MDVPPPLRRPRLRKLRVALIATGAVVVALLLAWMPGRARAQEICATCGTTRDSTAVGLFWDDDPLVAFPIGGAFSSSQAFMDTFAAWGHSHTWESEQHPPARFVASLFYDRTYCPSAPHLFHSDAAYAFSARPELRARMAILVRAGTWTTRELEDALLWCDDLGCPFGWRDLPQGIADSRANAHARLRPLLDEVTSQAR